MESVPKRNQTQRNKRRVRRAHQLLQQEKRGIDSGDENDDSPPGSSKDRGRSKPPRRRRNSSNSFEEDIIDGFAIFSFRSLGDLENAVKNSMNLKSLEKSESRPNSPHKDRLKSNQRRKGRKVSKRSGIRDPDDTCESSRDINSENRLNGPGRPSSKHRLSDVTSQSSSGGGYWCDSESGDERASDASSDTGIFGAARSLTRECLIPPTAASVSCNSTISNFTTIGTATSGVITTATVTTTSSASSTTTVTSITSTTPSATTDPPTVTHPWQGVSQLNLPHQNLQSSQHSIPSPHKRDTTPHQKHLTSHQKPVLPTSPKPSVHLHNPRSLSHSLPSSQSHPHTLHHTGSQSHSHPHPHPKFHSHSHIKPYSHSHPRTDNPLHSHTDSHLHPRTIPQSHSHPNLQSYAHTTPQSHSHINPQPHSHTNSPVLSHTNPQSLSHTNPQPSSHSNTQSLSHPNPNPQPHPHTNPQPHSHTNSQSFSHSNPQSLSHTNPQSQPRTNLHSHSNINSQPHSHTNPQPHSHSNSQSYPLSNLHSHPHLPTQSQPNSQTQHQQAQTHQNTLNRHPSPHSVPHQNSSSHPSSHPVPHHKTQSPHPSSNPVPRSHTPSPTLQLKSQTTQPSLHSSSITPLASLSSSFGPSSASLNNTASRDIKKQTPPLSRTPRREDSREREREYAASLVAFTKPAPRASSNPPSRIYSPHPRISPSPGIPLNLHSTQSQTAGYSGPSPFSLYHPATPHTSHPGMFATPLPPGPPAGPLSANSIQGASSLPTQIPSESMPALAGASDILREELNRRFLQAQDRGTPSIIGPTPLLHQHQHMHQHQHTHQHTYHGFGAPFSGGTLVPTPTPHLVPNISGYSGMSPLLPPSGPSGGLSSGIPGAFQPKTVPSNMHPAHMMLPVRERDKSAPPAPISQQKKSGKWCAVHVRIAWEIYHHQQKQQAQKTAEGKQMDSLQSHLFASGNLHRAADLGASTSAMMLPGGPPRLLLDACLPSLQSVALGISPFPRPSPYTVGTPLGIGGIVSGNGMFNSGREMPTVPGITPPHEWNRLHRTPSSFPTPPARPKTDDREKDMEREKEREKERERELTIAAEKRREEEKERERRNAERIGFDGNRFMNREMDTNSHSRSRSRSRSPLRNGRLDSLIYEKRFEDKNAHLKIKEERREEEFINAEREKLLRNEYLLGQMGAASNPLNMSMFDRARMLAPASILGPERVPAHPSLWNPVDKNPLDIARHNLQLRQEMERESRLLNSGLHPSLSASILDQVRLKEEILYDQEQRYFERLPFMERERIAYEQSKMPQLRAAEQFSMNHFQRTMSPMYNHHMMGKGTSPALIPGVPPPLIPSASATQSRSHTNSPSSGKSKGCSPSDSNNDLKDKRDSASNSTDPSR